MYLNICFNSFLLNLIKKDVPSLKLAQTIVTLDNIPLTLNLKPVISTDKIIILSFYS